MPTAMIRAAGSHHRAIHAVACRADAEQTQTVAGISPSILKGTLRYVTGLIGRANPAAIKVLTPTSTLGIRGTECIIDVPAND